MTIPRVHVDCALASGQRLKLPGPATQHVLRVLRLRIGEAVVLFNGRGGQYAAVLRGAGKQAAELEVGAHEALERESPLAICLLQGMARGERMDLIVQKATELGVARLVPLQTDRSVVRLDAAQAKRRVAHWRAVAAGACEQCGRNRLPSIEPVCDLDTALARADLPAARWLLNPSAPQSLAQALRAGTAAAVLLIGPEGGFSERELAVAGQSGFTAVGLGPRVLRTETAPLAALAIAQALTGDLA